MSAEGAARSAVSILLLIIGVLLLTFAVVDFLDGFGLLYCLVPVILGIVFLALSGGSIARPTQDPTCRGLPGTAMWSRLQRNSRRFAPARSTIANPFPSVGNPAQAPSRTWSSNA